MAAKLRKLNRPHRELLESISRGETEGVEERDADYIVEAARGIARARLKRNGPAVEAPEAVRDFLRGSLGALRHEVFGLVLLDTRHRVIDVVEMFRGTVDATSVHPREVVREVITRGAQAVILYHNHPSGIAEPSRADVRITAKLSSALGLVEVRLLDHMVVGGEEITSLAERGLL